MSDQRNSPPFTQIRCISTANVLANATFAFLAAVALANKTARIAWAVLTRGGTYAAPTAA